MVAENKEQSDKLTKKDYIWGGLGAAAVVPFTATTLFKSVAASETTAETRTAEPIESQQPANDLVESNVFGGLATLLALITLLTVAKEGTRNHDNVMVGFSTGVIATAMTVLAIFGTSQLLQDEKTQEDTQKNKTEIVLDRTPDTASSRNDSSIFYYTP